VNPRQLAPTVGIVATGFCYPGGILQIFLSTRSAKFATADEAAAARLHLVIPSTSMNFFNNNDRLHWLFIDNLSWQLVVVDFYSVTVNLAIVFSTSDQPAIPRKSVSSRFRTHVLWRKSDLDKIVTTQKQQSLVYSDYYRDRIEF
jgi:hypothetical protein